MGRQERLQGAATGEAQMAAGQQQLANHKKGALLLLQIWLRHVSFKLELSGRG